MNIRAGNWHRGLAVAALAVVALAGSPSRLNAQVPYPEDGKDATTTTLKNLRGARYMEFFLVGSKPVGDHIKGTCYNTTDLNLAEGSRDSCPQKLVDKLDPAQLAKEYKVGRVVINPPRQWLLDTIDIKAGAVREFGGLKAHWCAVMNMPEGKEWTPFTTATIARTSKFTFAKGKTVYLLDDPDGNTWIMKSVSPSVNSKNTYEDIGNITTRLKLPEGWKFRTKELDKELVLIPESGVARILRDDIDDVYDITGKGYSNFKP